MTSSCTDLTPRVRRRQLWAVTRTELKASERALIEAFQAGEIRALARAITWVENGRPGFQRLLSALHGRIGRAHRIGITGPPGAGKSTLIRTLALELRKGGQRVGVIAVDPSSPFTGGALLGDRIRMAESATDEGVFIRSMASRGSFGGLATTTREVADLLDAFGFDRVIVETVGVGQSELEIAGAADTTAVVLTPESGDSIQAMKAGLMEIADLFVVNKCDRPGAERAVQELRTMLHLRRGQTLRDVPAHHGVDLSGVSRRRTATGSETAPAGGASGEPKPWSVEVVKTVAESGEGVERLLETVDRHRAWLVASGEMERRRRERLVERVRAVVERSLRARAWNDGGRAALEAARADLEAGRRSPYDVADEILAGLK